MTYDVIIIGLGPSGIAASIYAKRGGLNTLVINSGAPGGLLNYTNVVNNYPGFENITGPDLASKMYDHFKSFEIDYKNENVVDILNGEVKTIVTNNGNYLAKNVIIATGRSRRSLNIPGEKELQGSGISYCALCDGHFYKGRNVAVIGGGDSALEEALYLSKIVGNIKLIVRGSHLTGKRDLIRGVEKAENIDIIFNSNVTEFSTSDGRLKGVVLNNGENISVDGVFVYIGFDPVLPLKSDLGFETEKGYLIVNEDFETNVEGIYAVGDIIYKKLYQIISAEYEGAAAASAISRKLTNKN